MILQVTDSGELILPAELVQAPPHTSLEVERHGETVTVKPVSPTVEHEESPAFGIDVEFVSVALFDDF